MPMLKFISLATYVAPILILIFGFLQKQSLAKTIVNVLIGFILAFLGSFAHGLAHLDCADNCVAGTDTSVTLLQAAILVADFALLLSLAKMANTRDKKLVLLVTWLAAILVFLYSFSYSSG
jgi:hypothetical protein